MKTGQGCFSAKFLYLLSSSLFSYMSRLSKLVNILDVELDQKEKIGSKTCEYSMVEIGIASEILQLEQLDYSVLSSPGCAGA